MPRTVPCRRLFINVGWWHLAKKICHAFAPTQTLKYMRDCENAKNAQIYWRVSRRTYTVCTVSALTLSPNQNNVACPALNVKEWKIFYFWIPSRLSWYSLNIFAFLFPILQFFNLLFAVNYGKSCFKLYICLLTFFPSSCGFKLFILLAILCLCTRILKN